MVEAQKPAEIPPEISYRYFAEQIDKETGIPVGMVPLEAVFERGLVNLPENATWHDVGAGVFASTKYILSKMPGEVKRSLTLIISDPVQPGAEFFSDLFADEALIGRDHKFHMGSANYAVPRETECDLVTMINMVHNVPEEKRAKLFRETFYSLEKSGKLLLSTSFMDKWWASRETMYFQALWKRAREAEAAERGVAIGEANFELWPAERYIQEIERAGLEIKHQSVEIMPCTVESYELISHDAEWLGNTMPGVGLETASDISIKSLRKVASEKGWSLDYPLPRNTLVVVATKVADVTENADRVQESELVSVV